MASMLTCYDIRLLLPHGNDIKRNLSLNLAFVNGCFAFSQDIIMDKTRKKMHNKSIKREGNERKGAYEKH